jgi:hypothetical protein
VTKAELQRLVDECCQRFDAVRARFAQDAKRDPGDKSTKLIVCWWEALQDLGLVECLEVVREIFTGKIPRPYPSDLPGTIACEVRRRQAAQSTKINRDWAKNLDANRAEAEKARKDEQDMEAKFGPLLDAMPPDELTAFAANVLPPFWLARWERNPRGLLVRQELLQFLETIQRGKKRMQEVTACN